MKNNSFLTKLKKILNIDIRRYILLQIKCLILLLIFTLSSVIFPSFITSIVDYGVVKGNNSAIIFYSLIMIACGLIMIASYYLQNISFYKLGNEITLNIRKNLFTIAGRGNLKFWEKNKVGDILTVLESDVDQIQALLTNELSSFITNILLFFGISYYIMNISMKIGVIVILLSLVFAFIQKKVSNVAKKRMFDFRESLGTLNVFSNKVINHSNAISMCGDFNQANDIYNKKSKYNLLNGLLFTKTMTKVGVIGMLFNIIAIVLVLLIGSFEVTNNMLSVGSLFTLTIYVQRLYSPIIQLSGLLVRIRTLSPIVDKIYELQYTDDLIQDGTVKDSRDTNKKIQFKNVSFAYDKKQVLKNLTFTINSKDIVAIKGNNGTGKSTIIRLLFKLCECNSGEVLVDGINVKDYDIEYLYSNISCMVQEYYILPDMISSFIDEKFYNYLEYMNFNDDIEKFIKYNQNINNEEIRISGGQMQKIILYKLLSSKSNTIILDEPTSAFDTISSKKIISYIRDFCSDKTLVIITHDDEIIEKCDYVIDLNKKGEMLYD